MVLNNEHQYTTSEKSARYTKFNTSKDSPITPIEVELYKKWADIFKILIQETYPHQFRASQIEKLAMENARYFISIFAPTTSLIYTVPLAQLNRIARWMLDYLDWKEHPLNARLAPYFEEFIAQLKRLNVLEPRLHTNEKERRLSLFARPEDVLSWEDNFSLSYTTTYKGSFAQLAQAHRHRTLDYQFFIPDEFEVYVPPILNLYPKYRDLWISDIQLVKDYFPQGQLIRILEQGTLDNLILKCKERLCSAAQLEIMQQTSSTLTKYWEAVSRNPYLEQRLDDYIDGARCSFPDYTCLKPCGFQEGMKLTRVI